MSFSGRQGDCYDHANVMSIRHFSSVVVALALFAAGCSGSPATPTSPSAGNGSLALTGEQIAGTWTLSAIQVTGRRRSRRPPARPTRCPSRMADCRPAPTATTALARSRSSGNTLNAGPALACTRAACPTMAFETAYTGILSGEHSCKPFGKHAGALLRSRRAVVHTLSRGGEARPVQSTRVQSTAGNGLKVAS